MREILFKAKRKDNGKWVEGYYIYHIKRTICPLGDNVKPEDEQHVIMQDGFSDWNMPRNTVVYEINPDTICQYTGLTDKNGKKIWENDIVRNKKGDIGVAQWFEEHAAFMIWNKTKNCVCYLAENDFSKIEVNGNVFDNLELLEAKE